MPVPNNILALDAGEKRVGIAIASMAARLPRPLTTLERGDDFFERLQQIIRSEDVGQIVVGWPRGLDGQATGQTAATERFVEQLKQNCDLPVHLQDEALTSRQAEAELRSRRRSHAKVEIDALAATYILEDFLTVYPQTSGDAA